LGKSAPPEWGDRSQVLGPDKRLERIAALLTARVADLEGRIQSGNEAAWEPYLATLNTLAAILPHVAPGARGELLTTKQMAERLGIAPKTLLKHKSHGAVRPALQRGKLIRWKGDEVSR
jgi:hypothetical protein